MPAPADPAVIAGEVSLRIEQWFQAHRLALPPETQAESCGWASRR
jgi:hypothetical protein